MNKDKMINLNTTYFKCTTINLIIICLIILNGVGCISQANQKKNTSIETTKTSEQGKDGLRKTYHQNGQLKSEGNYTSGLKEGLHKEWDENGILLLKGFYNRGKANGLMQWYHDKGHLAGEGQMLDDVRFGAWKICDIQENGFCIEAHFKNGKRDGVWKIYHESARDKLWKEQTFKEDKMISESCWDENGQAIDCK